MSDSRTKNTKRNIVFSDINKAIAMVLPIYDVTDKILPQVEEW